MLKIVIDMNLSPQWVSYLQEAGLTAVHWSTLGQANAPDREIEQWAIENQHIIFTNDLDFSAILAASQSQTPSVFQIRTQDLFPETMSFIVIEALQQFETELLQGALISLDENRSRVRILPIGES